MQIYYCPGRKEMVEVASPLAAGGEGAVHLIPAHQGLVAKILKHPEADDRRARVETLIAHSLHGSERWRFAAPEDLLLDRAAGQFAGYTMPLVSNADALDEFFDPGGTRYRRDPAFRVGLAIAVAEMVSEIYRHALDIVICDLKPQNILADDRGNVTLIDIDYVQMTTIRGTTYLSSARSEFYMAPEVYGMDLRRQRREQSSDLFALAVIIFQLLMGGWHPCASAGQADLAGQIRRGTFPHVAGSPDRPPPQAPPFAALPEELRHLFTQMFVDGFWDPGLRPTADEWVKALKQNAKELTRRPQVLAPPAAQIPAAVQPQRKFRRAVATVAAAALVAAAPNFFPAMWQGVGAGLASLAGPAAPAPDVQAASASCPPFAPTDDLRGLPRGPGRGTETPAYWKRLRDGEGEPLSFESSDTERKP
jgi:DNA-binding helix-hairpin-helix protein with protein kinase domain